MPTTNLPHLSGHTARRTAIAVSLLSLLLLSSLTAMSQAIVINELEYTLSKYFPDECSVRVLPDYEKSPEGNPIPVARDIDCPLEVLQKVSLNGRELRVTEVGWGGFEGFSFKSVTLPPSIVTVDNLAFRNTEGLFHIPGSVDIIGHYAFAGSKGKIELEEGIRFISDNAFGGFVPNPHWSETGLIALPSTVEAVGRTILGTDLDSGTDASFTEIQCFAIIPPEVEEGPDGEADICSNSLSYSKITLYVPDKSVEAYRSAPGWGKFRSIKPLSQSGIHSLPVTEGIIIEGVDGRIVITCDNPAPIPVKVYSADGRQVYFGHEREIRLSPGVYIVRASSTTAKIRL